MEGHSCAAPLRVGVVVIGGAHVARAAQHAVTDSGHQLAGALGRADLQVVIVDSAVSDTERLGPPTLGGRFLPRFTFVNTALAADELLPLLVADPDGLTIVRYDGPRDLRWKVAQTLASYLSAGLRDSLRVRHSLLNATADRRYDALIALAVHRDLEARRLAGSVVSLAVRRSPADAEGLALRLLATGQSPAFGLIARVLQSLQCCDPGAARKLLGDLTTASPAFFSWLLGKLES